MNENKDFIVPMNYTEFRRELTHSPLRLRVTQWFS